MVVADERAISAQHCPFERYRPLRTRSKTRHVSFWLQEDFGFVGFFFRDSPYGIVQAYAYPAGHHRSVLIVETTPQVLQAAGLDDAPIGKTLEFCSTVFAAELNGCPLMPHDAVWKPFVTVQSESPCRPAMSCLRVLPLMPRISQWVWMQGHRSRTPKRSPTPCSRRRPFKTLPHGL